ncbi:50S ribosomal protein L10 [Caloranaerobacter azorensis]|uniref:Large ribosomal subunit protein uL10 n=3 Tax=Caloranaerobacter azorensis TaxID=116090 RepID=A0A1M5WL48_9FIRM|nr:50S ribosomal protein L10 [Caloranaerobacter azorensis]KGG79795.1 50S ribosomal protein L10 [Caloranaerobacter azorensis H53214]QIB27155.1 50S ribosomal protein L10 [Caloranaerobacter azorensis]SHH87783.1 LSU ribosomal protein L10P [Caloranaerobacter azorensis DSM 13643]
MSNKIEQKKQIVQEIKDKIDRAQAVVLVDYRGLNVEEVNELRKKYREAGVEYKVYKNTLMRFAFKEAGLEEFNNYLTGPNAVAFSYDDPVSAAKVTSEFAKEHDKLEIKAGIVDGEIIDINRVKELANLPSREVLIAQVLGGLNGPITGFANVLQGTIRKLVYALNAIKEKQEA